MGIFLPIFFYWSLFLYIKKNVNWDVIKVLSENVVVF